MDDNGRSGRRTMTVGTSSTVISTEQTYSKRILFSLINISTGGQTISVAFGEEAVAGQGIVLAPGGSYTESRDPSFNPTNEQINAVSSAAGGTLSTMERIETSRLP